MQRGRLLGLCDRFRPSVVLAEENSIGAPIIEQLVRDGVPVQPFVTSNSSKAEIIDALTLAFERQTIRIVDDPVLIGELESFEATRLPSGLMRYAAAEGCHDDTVMALALAWWAACGGLAAAGTLQFEALIELRRREKEGPTTPAPEVQIVPAGYDGIGPMPCDHTTPPHSPFACPIPENRPVSVSSRRGARPPESMGDLAARILADRNAWARTWTR